MNIAIRVRGGYGREWREPIDPETAAILQELTGTKTLTERQIAALEKLGITVSETEIMGRQIVR